jgi:hypothetical protein
MTINQIKKLTAETAPYYFARDTMRFFKQKMSDFKVSKCGCGKYKIKGKSPYGTSVRYFNPSNNELEVKCGSISLR